MANGHWSQFSHKPSFFGISVIPFVLTLPLVLLGQISSIFWWILAVVWVYVIIFEKILKMPLQYTIPKVRTWLTGTDKEPRNDKDSFEL